jgi:hypothetical protein
VRPFSARFLAASSAQLDDSFSLLTCFLSPGLRSRGRRARCGLGLVDRALDAFLGGSAGFGSSGFLATSTFFGPRHHRANGRGLGLGGLAAAVQVGLGCLSSASIVGRLDHAQRRLGGSAA